MGFSATLALPTPAHIESKVPEPAAVPTNSRKQAFQVFSASSLSSLALGRIQSKRNSLGSLRKGAAFTLSHLRDTERTSDTSRPPSLVTDNSSLTSSSSRSPSPEPSTAASKLETAYKDYSATQSPKVLQNILIPTLTQSHSEARPVTTPSISRKTSLTTSPPRLSSSSSSSNSSDLCPLDESDVNVLFKWWNHLLLLSIPSPETSSAIYAIAAHPALRNTMFWNAHYELTLSTIMCHPSAVLPSSHFAKLITLGYLYHDPTSKLLRSLFTDPTKVSSAELWVRRAKNVEVFVETSKHVFALSPTFSDGGVIETRLEEMISKVVHVTTFPNHRLINLARLLTGAEGALSVVLERCLMRIAKKIGAFDCVAAFYLLDMMSSVKLTELDFWLEVMDIVLQTENHILQIRVFAFLYEHWSLYSCSTMAQDLILLPQQWEHFFSHWSGIVRDHYMRLIAYQVCLTHPYEVRSLLMRSFETSLLENCQLRDCLPGNPIPNKRFVIRPLSIRLMHKRPFMQRSKGVSPAEMFYDESASLPPSPEAQTTTGLIKKKLGLFRGFWNDEVKEDTVAKPQPSCDSLQNLNANSIVVDTSATISTGYFDDDSSTGASYQQFKFFPEHVGKQWSLTSDEDAISFLDSVMDAARDGRLPLHSYPLPMQEAKIITSSSPSKSCTFLPLNAEDEEFIHPFALGEGRKKLWTRSLSEWSIMLDDTDRFWKICGARSLPGTPTTPGFNPMRIINCPKLEVEFPKWFVQKSTQVPGDGIDTRPRN